MLPILFFPRSIGTGGFPLETADCFGMDAKISDEFLNPKEKNEKNVSLFLILILQIICQKNGVTESGNIIINESNPVTDIDGNV